MNIEKIEKAILEFDGRSYIYSCDQCGRITTKVTSFFFGPHGEKIDLCSRCLDPDRWGEKW